MQGSGDIVLVEARHPVLEAQPVPAAIDGRREMRERGGKP